MFVFYMSNYDKIVNPATGKKVNITGKLGKSILENYKKFMNVTSKPIYNQTGGAHQLQRMIAALLVEGGLTFRKNFGAGLHNEDKSFDEHDTTAYYVIPGRAKNRSHSGNYGKTKKTGDQYSSYSGRAKTDDYNKRRSVIQKIKHSADMHIMDDNDTDILTESLFFYHYDPTNTFSTSAQSYIDDYIIDFVLNIDGTDPEKETSKEFSNIFFKRQLWNENRTKTPPLFFTSRYRNNNGSNRQALDTVNKRFQTGNKKYSTATLNLGLQSDEIDTLRNFPATEQIYIKYMRALPTSQEISLDDWITNLITKRKNSHKIDDSEEGKIQFNEAWEAENIIREIYLQSIFDALINITDLNKDLNGFKLNKMN